ncbi:MAG: adenylosuccinate synthase [Mailhella sp.]|nr:adenylosuccinate synthase [Mailhella sp.]
MGNITVFGSQWGDEGKGKIVDLLSADVDYVVRYQGGNNAGHTVIVNGKRYVLHIIPSGILHEGKICVIGNGVVLDPFVFLEEVDALIAKGVAVSPDKLIISPKTHLIMPYHRLLDGCREGAAAKKIGTTGRGIGPCYEDKVARRGIRCGDLASPETVRARIEECLSEKNALFTQLYGREPLDADTVFSGLMAIAPRLLPYLRDVSSVLQNAYAEGKTALFEGAQGAMLDIDHGTYPFVTSSNTVAGSAATGSGAAPASFGKTVAIVKAYTTRVGEGPFPTELDDETGRYLQNQGGEFGATTGRPRRCGWFDACVVRESVRLCAPDTLALMKLDVLGGLDEIKICTGYEVDGQIVSYPPQTPGGLADAVPVYESMPGWKEDISACTKWSALPENARAYVSRLEELTGVPAGYISVGPDRAQTIVR